MPPGAKREAKREDSSNPFACPSSRRMFGFSSNKASKSCELSTTQDEEASSSLKKKRNEVQIEIHEVNCKSPEGGCIGEEVEDECTSSFLVGDLQITAQGFGSCMGVKKYFVLFII